MTNLKKLTIAAAMTTCLMAATNASASDPADAADPVDSKASATLLWHGTVPETGVSDRIVITGEGGDLAELNGTIIAEVDGTFKSSSLIIEARKNDGTSAEDFIVGDPLDVNWTLKNASVTYGGADVKGAEVVVYLNDEEKAVGATVDKESSIKAAIHQTAELDASDVAGKAVAASITLMADVAS
tara:strand:- start:1678 stop:2232 length:555 start_codon:yes stop_codon:yes gene_type:complete